MTKSQLIKTIENDTFLASYFETALWASSDESDDAGGEPMDENYSLQDFDKDTLQHMIDEMEGVLFDPAVDEWINGRYEDAGHDFWLTRNGHGAGFWDGDWPEPEASKLTKVAERLGEISLYVGDDGVVYAFSG